LISKEGGLAVDEKHLRDNTFSPDKISEQSTLFRRPLELRSALLFLLFLFVVTLFVFTTYSNTLRSPFLLDDFGNIVHNASIEIDRLSWKSLEKVWLGSQVEGRRKLSYLSFAINYWWQGYNPYGFHVVNIAIHICCAVFFFLFSYKSLDTGWLREKYGAFSFWLAAVAAIIWALHPIQVNAVTYIVQRMTSLAVLFALMALTAWLWGRESWIQQRRFQALGWWTGAFVSWCLGLLSKEHVAIVPVLIVVHELFLLRRGRIQKIKWNWIFLLGVFFAALCLYYLGSDPIQRILGGYVKRDFTLMERLLTESRVLWHYISLFFVPISKRFSLFYDYPLSTGIFSPITTCIAMISWSGLLFFSWYFREKYPIISWMTAWFLVSNLIESTIIPLEIIFEHRMYLPSSGLSMGVVLICFDAFQNMKMHRAVSVCFLLAFLCVLSFATYSRNLDFRNEVALYRSELQKFPDSQRNRLGLALALNHAGRFSEGGRMLEEMAEAYPYDFVVQQNWYNFLVRIQNDHSRSEQVYKQLYDIIENGHYDYRHDAIALKNFAELLFERGYHKRALVMVDRLLVNYRKASFYLLKGVCHVKLKNWYSANKAFRDSWKRNPRNANMIYWYSYSLIQLGQLDKACAILNGGLEKAVEDKKAHSLCQDLSINYCNRTDQRN
jgi:tetratricopeptide (TPR) repeat protein